MSCDLLSASDGAGVRVKGAQADSEIGCGFTLADGSWTLVRFQDVMLSEWSPNEFRLGSRIKADRDITFAMEGS